jgi:hypothetical protein
VSFLPRNPCHTGTEQRADDQRTGEKAHAVIVSHTEAGDHAAGQPPAAVADPPDPDNEQRQPRPRQQRMLTEEILSGVYETDGRLPTEQELRERSA